MNEASPVQTTTYPPSSAFSGSAHVDRGRYEEMYARSVEDPASFWGDEGKRLDWIRPYTRVKDTSFALGNVSIKWFEDGTLNVAANCIDRHLETRGEQTAIIWEPDDPAEPSKHIWPARGSARSTRWCSRGSRPTRWPRG
jgi:acetyl-CoA synthetase